MKKEYLQTVETDTYIPSSFQSQKKINWEDELIIASRELEFLSKKNEMRVAEFIIPSTGIDN